MKKLIIAILAFASTQTFAGGWSEWAVPTKIDVERGGGFMIYGSFGNAGGCVSVDKLYVKIDHPQYKVIYATALAAFSGKSRIQAYVHSCESVGWYAAAETTFNIVQPYSALNISN